MTQQTDNRLHQDHLKRSLLRWRIGAIVAVFAVVVFSVLKTPMVEDSDDKIQRIWIKGIILEDERRLEDIADAVDDDAVKAIVIRIDSPGGTVVGGETLYRALNKARAVKPVVAVMGTTAASGGYMTALGADRIFAHEGTITGSIGVILQSADLRGLLGKIGVEPRTFRSGPLKAQPSPLEDLSDDVRAVTMGVINDMFAQFKEMVVSSRGLTVEQVDGLADGRIFTGRQALKVGLIDAIGGEDEAVLWLQSEHGLEAALPVVDIKRDPADELIRRLSDPNGGKALISEVLGLGMGLDVGLDGMLALWHPDI